MKNPYAVALGVKSKEKNLERDKDYYKNIGSKGAKTRWKKKKKISTKRR